MNKAPSTLGYNILSCTSEDSAHPISSIQSSSIRSTGWQSSPNPRYPIEFILDLGSNAEIDTIQFVSHQFKIAARVDLYVASSDRKFQALGSFQFSDNSFSNFTARELKSATLNGIKAQFIKVSIPGCHANGNNSTNQVGLISLNVIGKGGSLMKTQPINVKSEGTSSDMLEQLERQKREAVEKEHFKQAEILKQQIDRLRRAYSQITALQQQKNEAIAHEDYATALRLKNEIDFLLKGEASSPSPQQQQMMQSQQIQQTFNRTRNAQNLPPPESNYMDEEPEPAKPPPRRKANNNNSNSNNNNNLNMRKQQPIDDGISSLEDAIPPKPRREIPRNRQPDERPIHPSKDAFDQDRPIHPSKPNPVDERPIHPAKSSEGNSPKRAPPHAGPGGDNDLVKEPEELKPEEATEAGLLIDLFGKRPVACFYSHAWNLRVSGITELAKMICGLKDNQVNAFSRYCYIIRKRVQETHKAVFQAALENVMSTAEKLDLSRNDLERCINQFIPQLIPKVGCAQAALSKLSCKFLIWLCEKEQYDIVVPIITKPLKNQNQYLIALAQIKTMRKIIMAKGDLKGITGLTLPAAMGFVVPCLESPKNEVRTEAIKMVVALEAICGSTIYQYFEKVNPKVRAAIDSAIKSAKEE
ncbi:UvrB/uvrC motif family protein [Tritrichomonas foetus]|uniref:UvrB/uvrC motif family protein n=1 Tax=Tritrichomonas foetus TaxID=1144522 RepID=A0A1J4K796_9EUKA|nr:UvrB/uvrC motif family protein [Tritrichomonas foetus]|eukprot:OHT07263.1 UvrB/uvrC motif family protein [Tritrichomonas foetus]